MSRRQAAITEVDNELKAGEISLHSDLLLHGSGLNTSDRRRCGLTLRFCAASVRAELDWNREGVIVRGIDPTGHWSDQPRPEVDNVQLLLTAMPASPLRKPRPDQTYRT